MFELTPFGRRNCMINNPFRMLEDIEKNFFSGFSIADFKTDIKDNGDSYLLEADLAGFNKEDINIDIDGNYLRINAKRMSDTEESGKNYIKSERTFGSFTRSFDISSVNADEITAEYKNGVLKLTMPKKDSLTSSSRRLEIQ